MDNRGKLAIEPQLYVVSCFSDGLTQIYMNGKYCCFDKTQKVVIISRV
ncbi:WG repeat-containing protein [Microcoleus sp. FACHB-831]